MSVATRVVLLLTVPALAASAAWADWPDPALTQAQIQPRASRALLLDGVRLGTGRLVLVGERGHVLLSDDEGAGWRQVPTPTRSTLTAVAGAGDSVVAVGHDGVILVSDDQGTSWQRSREEPFSPDNLNSESNGSPLLDVVFLDDRRVLAVGAYSLLLASDDAGASWRAVTMQRQQQAGTVDGGDAVQGVEEPLDQAPAEAGDSMLFSEEELTLDDEVDPHLNAVVRTGPGRLLLVGERGTVLASTDEGANWQALQLPYAGSMFGALHLGGDRVLVFGLRGNAFQSDDHGRSWQALDTGVQASLFGADLAGDGTVTLAGAEGAVLRWAPDQPDVQATVFSTDSGETPVISSVLATGDGSLLLVGERGVARWRQQP